MPTPSSFSTALTARQQDILKRYNSSAKMRYFFIKDLPTLWWWGVRVEQATPASVGVSVPYGWRTQNPFQSTYFAAQSGAAELSTGLLVLLAAQGESRRISTLVVNFEAQFTKKATERVTYTCQMGEEIFAAVHRCVELNAPQAIVAESIGKTPAGVDLGRLNITKS